jgi:hypothetical protein
MGLRSNARIVLLDNHRIVVLCPAATESRMVKWNLFSHSGGVIVGLFCFITFCHLEFRIDTFLLFSTILSSFCFLEILSLIETLS